MPNANNEYIYLKIPSVYKCTYDKLLIELSNLGEHLLKDCLATCKKRNNKLLNCWNMFQTAVAAYDLGEIKKANLIINYINKELRLDCKENSGDETKIKILNLLLDIKIINDKPNENILDINIESLNFIIQNKHLVKDNSLSLIYKNNNKLIYSNYSTNSPIIFPDENLINIDRNNDNIFYITIEDKTGNIIKSEEYIYKYKNNNKKPIITNFDLPDIINQ